VQYCGAPDMHSTLHAMYCTAREVLDRTRCTALHEVLYCTQCSALHAKHTYFWVQTRTDTHTHAHIGTDAHTCTHIHTLYLHCIILPLQTGTDSETKWTALKTCKKRDNLTCPSTIKNRNSIFDFVLKITEINSQKICDVECRANFGWCTEFYCLGRSNWTKNSWNISAQANAKNRSERSLVWQKGITRQDSARSQFAATTFWVKVENASKISLFHACLFYFFHQLRATQTCFEMASRCWKNFETKSMDKSAKKRHGQDNNKKNRVLQQWWQWWQWWVVLLFWLLFRSIWLIWRIANFTKSTISMSKSYIAQAQLDIVHVCMNALTLFSVFLWNWCWCVDVLEYWFAESATQSSRPIKLLVDAPSPRPYRFHSNSWHNRTNELWREFDKNLNDFTTVFKLCWVWLMMEITQIVSANCESSNVLQKASTTKQILSRYSFKSKQSLYGRDLSSYDVIIYSCPK
jgi:hypothetical protein